MSLHTDAIAENSAAGEGTGRIHGDDAHGFIALAVVSGETIDESAFARSGSAGDPGKMRLSGVREKAAQDVLGFGRVIFDGGDGAGNGTNVAGADAVRPVDNFRGHGVGGYGVGGHLNVVVQAALPGARCAALRPFFPESGAR